MGFGAKIKNGCFVLVVAVLIVQLSACGYFLYPERRGQTHGRIDPGVAILDGIGLLVFFIPGVIAFAVDFASGAIYLPPGNHRRFSHSTEGETVRMVRFNPIRASEKTIREIVESETGVLIGKELNQVEVYPLERAEDIQPVLMNLNASGFRTSIGTRIK